MTCIYTGAVPYLEDYSAFLRGADIYRVGNSIIIRWTGKGLDYAPPDDSITHKITIGFDTAFFREDIGILVVPENCVEGERH